MNRQQFIGYLQNLQQLPQDASVAAQAVADEYPYFHAAHLLLAVAYERQQDVRSAQAIRKAAAFLPSRAMLYAHLNHSVPNKERAEAAHAFIPEIRIGESPAQEVQASPKVPEEVLTKPATIEQSQPTLTSVSLEGESLEKAILPPTIDPLEPAGALKSRSELEQDPELSSTLPSTPAMESDAPLQEATSRPHEGKAASKFKGGDWLETAAHVSATDPFDELDKEWLSKGIETGVSLGVSEIGSVKEGKLVEIPGTKTFLDWLKAPKPAAEIETKEDPKKKVQSAIIDRFIVQDPRISKPKAEFFTPQQAAKQSLVNDPNLASETLAGIYELQGNFGQAVKIYEALALKFPGKSLYFASLAKKAREKHQQNRSK